MRSVTQWCLCCVETAVQGLLAWFVVGVVATLSVCVTGCQTPDVLSANTLPAQFRAVNSVYRPSVDWSVLAQAAIDSDRVYVGDVLAISVRTGAEMDEIEPMLLKVDLAGSLDVPVIGQVPVAGLTLSEVEQAIRDAGTQRRLYRDPVITVAMDRRKTDSVRVAGAVDKPGTYDLPSAGNDLLAAISAAGGPTEDADVVIEVRHPQREPGSSLAAFDGAAADESNSMQVDLLEVMGGRSQNLRLHDGSVVVVRERMPEKIYVTGLVEKAGDYSLPMDHPLRVTQAIAMAGGRRIEIADKVYVIRRFEDGRAEPSIIEVSYKQAKANRDVDLVLQNGDTVSVEDTPLTFTVSTVRDFFRVGFNTAIPGF